MGGSLLFIRLIKAPINVGKLLEGEGIATVILVHLLHRMEIVQMDNES